MPGRIRDNPLFCKARICRRAVKRCFTAALFLRELSSTPGSGRLVAGHARQEGSCAESHRRCRRTFPRHSSTPSLLQSQDAIL